MVFVLFLGSDSPVEAVFSVFKFFGAMFGTELTNRLSKLTCQENREEPNEF